MCEILPLESTDIERSLVRKFIENNKNDNKKDKKIKHTEKKKDYMNNDNQNQNQNQNENQSDKENNEWSFTEDSLKKEIFVSELSKGYIGLIKIFSALDVNILENLNSNVPKETGARVEGIDK